MHLFYPSHDIALANGVRHFNPPAMALHLQEDLAYLSDIWNLPYHQGQTQMPIPWGWDYDTRQYLSRHAGVKASLLPSDAQLETLRQLSSRRTVTLLTDGLYQQFPQLIDNHPIYFDSEATLAEYIADCDAKGKRFVLKTPWSSSGRGVMPSHVCAADGTMTVTRRDVMLAHARSTIRKMGGIMAEDWIEDKQQDFAMLFYAQDTEIHFIGYSLFDNDNALGGTTYRQGYLLSNAEIERCLISRIINNSCPTCDSESMSSICINADLLYQLARYFEQRLTSLLSPLLGHSWPLGYMGIDMLTTSHSLCPCIELNLRTTMGIVCRLWHDQHLQDGIFSISAMQSDGHFHAQFHTHSDS